MSDDDDHDHSELSEVALRVRALETILVDKGYVDPAALDAIVETYETKVGPRNGARVVARAWSDAEFRERLRADATARHRRIGLWRPAGRTHGRGREHAGAAQSRRLHFVLLLSVAGAGPAAGLVQIAGLSLPRRHRSARRSRRIRREAAGRGRNPRLGFDRRGALSRRADAASTGPTVGARSASPRWSRATA